MTDLFAAEPVPVDFHEHMAPEIERLRGLLREVYRDGLLPQVLKGKIWNAING